MTEKKTLPTSQWVFGLQKKSQMVSPQNGDTPPPPPPSDATVTYTTQLIVQ